MYSTQIRASKARTGTRRVLTVLCSLGLAIIATTTATIIAGLKATEASISFYDTSYNASYTRHLVGGSDAAALFTANEVNDTTLAALMNVINAVKQTPKSEYTAEDFSEYVKGSKAQGAVYVRLFAPVAGTTDTLNFTTSPNDAVGTKNAARWWRVVYMKGHTLTLWMAEGYKNSTFGGSSSWDYSNSAIRSTINTDFASVISQLGITSTMNRAIVKDNNPYQDETGNGSGTANAYKNPAVPADDSIWLPSAYEVFTIYNNTTNYGTATNYGSSRSGQWMLNGYDRAYNHTAAGVQTCVWLRSGLYSNSSRVGLVYLSGDWEGTNGDGSATLTKNLGVRPAIHINLGALAIPTINAEIE